MDHDGSKKVDTMVQNTEHERQTDGGKLQTKSSTGEVDLDDDQPAFGFIARTDLGVIENLRRTSDYGADTFLVTSPDADPVIRRTAQALGATVFEPPVDNPTREELRDHLATYADANNAPGIIVPTDSTTPIAVERSVEAFDGESFLVDAVTEKNTLEPTVLVAIPAYNEAKTIADVVRGARRHADHVIVVDDASTDETAAEAHAAGATVIEHDENKGYGGALNTAFREAAERNADHLVILDGDGQHDPDDIPQAVNIQKENSADIVIGSRFADGSNTDLPIYRRFGIEVVNTLTNLTMGVIRPKSWVRDTQSGFRTYNRRAIESLSEDQTIGNGMSASTDILHHAHHQDYNLEEFGTTIDYEVENASSQNPVSHGITLVMNLLQTIEHERPVTSLGVPGFISSFIGLGFGYWTFHNYIQTGIFPMGLAVSSTFFTLAGIFACFTAIILHSLNTHLNE
ncbi:glycosyltransferase family 2 protein [Halobaculum sp. EA56]|uniref:glycosyltransferase family 2 protein n=1 Tax=Halobaculum sp. EA56 TaxID=3421648 RepID=UPI003EC1515C